MLRNPYGKNISWKARERKAVFKQVEITLATKTGAMLSFLDEKAMCLITQLKAGVSSVKSIH